MSTTSGSVHGTLSHARRWRAAIPLLLRSIGVVVTLVLGMLVAVLAAALPRATAARIALLGFGPPPSATAPQPFAEAFQHGLRDRGWVEGHNLAIEWRWTEGDLDQFATLVAEVIRLQVEVIVVPNATTAWIAKKATSTIPIVVVGGGSMLETGLTPVLHGQVATSRGSPRLARR